MPRGHHLRLGGSPRDDRALSHDDVPLPGPYPNGEVVSGSISAPTAVEVSERVEYLGFIPIETVRDEGGTGGARWDFTILSLPRPEDVTVFTGDLALLLQTGARINDALELLSADADIIARCPAPGL